MIPSSSPLGKADLKVQTGHSLETRQVSSHVPQALLRPHVTLMEF